MTTPLRLLIADDEPAVREELRAILATDAAIDIIAECPNALDALRAIRQHKPDAVLLDIQMPGLTGIEVVAALEPDERPAVAFVTAYDTFAVRAFELHAVDYVLKPFDDARVLATIGRLRHRIGRGQDGITEAVRTLLDEKTPLPDRFVVQHGKRLRVIPAEDIDWIEAADNYVRIHAGGGSSLLRETMSRIEQRLDGQQFMRVHRSVIVNISRIRELQITPNGDYQLTLANGERVPMSRTYRDAVMARLGA